MGREEGEEEEEGELSSLLHQRAHGHMPRAGQWVESDSEMERRLFIPEHPNITYLRQMVPENGSVLYRHGPASMARSLMLEKNVFFYPILFYFAKI